MTGPTRGSLVRAWRARFAEAGVETPDLDARILLAGLLGIESSRLVLDADVVIDPDHLPRLEAAALRRLAQEPVHRILGQREFYGREFTLSPATLEPRPDTEILVDALLPWLLRRVEERGSARVLDLGTGTGALLVTLLAEVPGSTGVAVDLSAEALETAAANAARHGVGDRFEVCRSDWFSAVEGLFDLILSNPPYIASTVVDGLSPEVLLHDPRLALDGGADGLVAYRKIAEGALAHLAPEGTLGVEIGYDQRESVTMLFEDHGFHLRDQRADYGGQDRVLFFACHSE